MNIAIKTISSMLVAVVLSSVHASGQTADKTNASRPVKTDTAKPNRTTAEATAKEGAAQAHKTNPPAEQPEKEEKKWGLQVVTGEKWYQVSIKLVM